MKKFAEKQRNGCFRGLKFTKIFFAPNHGRGLTQSYIKNGGSKIWLHITLIGKPKTKFCHRFNNYKSKHERLERIIGKFLRNYFTLTVVSMATAALKIGIL